MGIWSLWYVAIALDVLVDPAPRDDDCVGYADQRSGRYHRVCRRGFTMAGVHLCGMGRVGDGLVTAVWVMGAEPAHLAIASYSLQLRHTMPYRATLVSPALW